MAERITGHTELVSLLAYPIRHSSSPAMHNEAFAYLGLDYAYLAFEVDNDTLEDAIKWAAAAGGDADLSAWNVAEYPKPQTEMEMMMDMIGKKAPDENIFAGTPLGDAAGTLLDWYARVKKNPADVTFARIPYLIEFR